MGGDVPVRRSAIRWQRRDGEPFRKGELLGYCGLSLGLPVRGQGDFYAMETDRWDFQVALIAELSGRFHRLPSAHGGGWRDIQPVLSADPDTPLAMVEPLADLPPPGAPLLSFHFTAGRRACELAEDRSGLLTGWHDRSRAWREGSGGPWGTLLGMGTCELRPILMGESGAFLELLSAAGGAAHVVEVPDRPLVHSARIIAEQLRRSDAERETLARLFAGAVGDDPVATVPGDWAFAAMAVQALQRSPASESYDVLGAAGVTTLGPADALILSVNSESPFRMVHRELGFAFDCHNYRASRFSDGLRAWFARNFSFERHSVEDARRDFIALAGLMREVHPRRQILVLNAMATVSSEDMIHYDAFDAPLSQTLRTVRARELNGMLHDLAREIDIAIVDVDAIGAELGSGIAIPDGVHQNGAMQAEIRAEILSILRGRGVPGFGPALQNLEVHG